MVARQLKRWVVLASALSAFSACDSVNRMERPLPENFTATTLDGKRIDRAFFEGKPWLVNVWVPGCGLCAGEFPTLDAVARAYDERGVGMLLLSIEADADVVEAAAKKLHLKLPVAILHGSIIDELSLGTVPSTFFMNEDATVVAVARGAKGRGFFERRLDELAPSLLSVSP